MVRFSPERGSIDMKIERRHLTFILMNVLGKHITDEDGGLTYLDPSGWSGEIEQCEFALTTLKALRDGKKRIIIDVVKDSPRPPRHRS